MAVYKGKRPAFDTNSIKTATLSSFVVFAMFMLAVIWGLSNFFINTYFEKARTDEIINTANLLETQFRQDRDEFYTYAVQTASANGIYIRIDNSTESIVFDGTRNISDTDSYVEDIQAIYMKLSESLLGSVSETKNDAVQGHSRLLYAKHINAFSEDNILYIIAPLNPDPATMRILTGMLSYISFIVLIVSTVLAFMLSRRITLPIENLTRSATELSTGNYNVNFDGSAFTETKELAKALNKASYEMEKTDFYQREIIANVSHDLKTPLTMIRSYAEKIMDISGDIPKKRNADLGVIINETERLNKLVGDILSVSNMQSNNIELHMETFDITEAARDVYESFEVLSSSQGFKMQFHPCKSCYVVGDRTRIMQVMSNFADNAVKYSGDDKYIEIRLARSGRKVRFHCIDHGIGIPSDEIAHVWDKYYRTSANHERSIEGTGLGLAIVKGILNLHNAKYGVDSKEGKGSDFWFELETVRKPSRKDIKKTLELERTELERSIEPGNNQESEVLE
ncbi:MAG: HAMP domain-containing histidine kinase [Mogibacterium sp.]|nr:HAMP domain-containing histidine kinase [Mogibacterium sp.]